LLAEIRNKIVKGIFVYSDYFPNSPKAKLFGLATGLTTIGDALDAYLADCVKAVEKKNMSPATLDGYRKAVRHHLNPRFGTTKLHDLKPSAIREWLKELSLTSKSVRNTLIPLRAVLDDAVNDDLIEANPLDKVALDRLLAKTTTKSTYVVDPFSPTEVLAIVAAATGQAKNFIQFAFATGLRTSEMIALRWKDVDWKARCVIVRVAVVEKTEKGTKTLAGTRRVQLDDAAYAALEGQKSWTLLQGNRVFHNPRTNLPLSDDQQIRKSLWLPAIKAAEVRYRNPYQTRHTFASTLLSSGANPWWVQEQMGHKTVEMIFKVYGKWIPDTSATRAVR
jgi:integrase